MNIELRIELGGCNQIMVNKEQEISGLYFIKDDEVVVGKSEKEASKG